MITGTPCAAGSNRLWPPTGTKLPPTNATSTDAYSAASSPTVSPNKTWVSGRTAAALLRRSKRKPRRVNKSATA